MYGLAPQVLYAWCVQNEPTFDLVESHTHRNRREAVTRSDRVKQSQGKEAPCHSGCPTLPPAEVRERIECVSTERGTDTYDTFPHRHNGSIYRTRVR